MARGRKCKKFNWRWTDSEFIHVHQNNLRVFRKIGRMRKTKISRSVDKIINGLFVDEVWGERMRGKKRSSWKADYFRWDRLH